MPMHHTSNALGAVLAAAGGAQVAVGAATGDVALAQVVAPTSGPTVTVPVWLISLAIGAGLQRPQRLAGLHFFNPVHLMKLLEVVRAYQTDEGTLASVRAFGRRLGKELVEVKDSPGFASSRLGIALGMEAIRMVEEGVASAADIDRAMKLGYGHPMGPLELTDLVGLDVRLAISEHLHRELGNPAFRPPQLLKQMVRAGRLGKKAGRGFYTYTGD